MESQYYFFACVSEKNQIEIGGKSYLVNHHDGEEITDGGKEKSVKIVVDVVADGVAEDIQNDLADDKKENTESDVAQGPAILQRAQNKKELTARIDEKADCVHNVQHNEDADRILRAQASPPLEGEEGNSAAGDEHAEGA